MQSHDELLRRDLAATAAEAEPLGLIASDVVARVARRRRAATAGAVAMTVLALGGLVVGGLATVGRLATGPSGGVDTAEVLPFTCGELLNLPDTAPTRAGLTMSLTARRADEEAGPALTVTFTADRAVNVRSTPLQLFELLYLRDGVIVGGGPLLNQPGDRTPQAVPLVNGGFDLDPDHPSTDDLGPRDALCPGLGWPQIWSDPGLYEAVLVQGPVLQRGDDPQQLRVDIPSQDARANLVARAPLGP